LGAVAVGEGGDEEVGEEEDTGIGLKVPYPKGVYW